MIAIRVDGRFDERVTRMHWNSLLSHRSVVELFFLLDVSMVCAASLATLALVTAEDGGQLLLGYASWRQRDGALFSQTPTVLQEHTRHTHILRRWGQAQASTAFPHSCEFSQKPKSRQTSTGKHYASYFHLLLFKKHMILYLSHTSESQGLHICGMRVSIQICVQSW